MSTATTELYPYGHPLPLRDALPILSAPALALAARLVDQGGETVALVCEGGKLVGERLALLGQRGELSGEGLARRQRRLQLGRELSDIDAQLGVGAALERQQLGQLVDLGLEPRQRLVLAADGDREEELRHHENHEDEDHHQQQGGEGVDEAWPDEIGRA